MLRRISLLIIAVSLVLGMSCLCVSAADSLEIDSPAITAAETANGGSLKLMADDTIWPKDNKTNYEIAVGEKLVVTFYTSKRPVDGMTNLYAFKTSDKSIATVKTKTAGNADAVGKVQITGVSTGTAVITAYVKGGFAGGNKGKVYASTDIYVTVKDSGSTPDPDPDPQPEPTPTKAKITASPSTVELTPGGEKSVKVTVNLDPSQYDHITATAAKDSCFEGVWDGWVDDYSVYMTIKAKEIGSNDLTFSIEGTATNGEKVLAKTVVKVVVAKASSKKGNTIKVSSFKKKQTAKKQTFKLKATAKGGAKLTYKSNTKSVKVDKKGKVTIAKNYCGVAKITVTSAKTKKFKKTSKTVTVTVTPGKTSVKTKRDGNMLVRADWKKVPNVTGYQVEILVEGGTYDYAYDKSITKRGYDFSGFTAGSAYTLKVRAYKSSGGKFTYGPWATAKGTLS